MTPKLCIWPGFSTGTSVAPTPFSASTPSRASSKASRWSSSEVVISLSGRAASARRAGSMSSHSAMFFRSVAVILSWVKRSFKSSGAYIIFTPSCCRPSSWAVASGRCSSFTVPSDESSIVILSMPIDMCPNAALEVS